MMKMAVFMGVRLPPQDSEDAKKIDGSLTDRKGPIMSFLRASALRKDNQALRDKCV
jgi:hypothetical protein